MGYYTMSTVSEVHHLYGAVGQDAAGVGSQFP